jgi:hypothetical protein
MPLFGILGDVLPIPKATRPNDSTVVATATDVIAVVPGMRATSRFAVLALFSNAEVNQEPGEMPPQCSPPPVRRWLSLDTHLNFPFTSGSGRKLTSEISRHGFE